MNEAVMTETEQLALLEGAFKKQGFRIERRQWVPEFESWDYVLEHPAIPTWHYRYAVRLSEWNPPVDYESGATATALYIFCRLREAAAAPK